MLLSLLCIGAFAQSKSSLPYFGNEIVITDSSSTIMIPVEHSANPFSSTNNKLALFRNVHANFAFYDFVKDSARKLFDKNTYIESIENRYEFDFKIPSHQKIQSENICFIKFTIQTMIKMAASIILTRRFFLSLTITEKT
jgi:hypothetical protein